MRAVLTVAACALIGWPMSNIGFAEANLAMIFLLGVVYVAARCGRGPGILASIASVVVLDSNSGAVVASVPTVGTLDGLSYDPATRRIYTSGGEGFVDVTRQIDADHYERIARIPTGPGARTSMFVPDWRRLYVAVPPDKDRSAELRVFDVVPLNLP